MPPIELVPIETPADANLILGHAHFIKAAEDLYEIEHIRVVNQWQRASLPPPLGAVDHHDQVFGGPSPLAQQ